MVGARGTKPPQLSCSSGLPPPELSRALGYFLAGGAAGVAGTRHREEGTPCQDQIPPVLAGRAEVSARARRGMLALPRPVASPGSSAPFFRPVSLPSVLKTGKTFAV